MKFTFFYGPDKIPFSLPDRREQHLSSIEPFHGIISRGLLAQTVEIGLSVEAWYQYAHLMDEVSLEIQEPALSRLKDCVREYEVLSFYQSAFCAKKYVEQYYSSIIKEDEVEFTLWNIKEGHTSSVWKINMTGLTHVQQDPFVVNVARDKAAGIELKNTSEKMLAIAENCPGINMAKVCGIDKVSLNYFHEVIDVVITHNEWIPDAREIHFFPGNERQAEQYVLVERFLTSHDRPSQITSIHGRKFTESESNQIKGDIAFFLANACKVLPTYINLNEGDVVWTGEKAIVVAIS